MKGDAMRIERQRFGIFEFVLFFLLSLGMGACGSEADGGGAGGHPAGKGGSPGGVGGNPAGTGGGFGNAGGSGGSDGPIICGGLECAPGEGCSETRQCVCDPEADRCEGGRACDPMSLRCSAPTGSGRESYPCEQEGQRDRERGLECVRSGSALAWMRTCVTSDDCLLGYSFCWGKGHCYSNTCGDDRMGSLPNGKYFGECDASTGLFDEASRSIGTCLPPRWDYPYGVCYQPGDAKNGQACRVDASRRDPARVCGLGLHCPYEYLPVGGGCSSDLDCHPGQECSTQFSRCTMKACDDDLDCGDAERLYCFGGVGCVPFSLCQEICDGGSSESDEVFSSCTVGVCPSNERSRMEDHMLLSCVSECDPFGGSEACEPTGDTPHECVPWLSGGESPGGYCRGRLEEAAGPGEDCSSRPCQTGAICLRGQEAICAPLCSCEAGFAGNLCPVSSPLCSGDEVCYQMEGHLGFCWAQQAGEPTPR